MVKSFIKENKTIDFIKNVFFSQACSKTEPRLKPCFTGYFGGDSNTLPAKPHRCSLPIEQQTEDYHALMCIMYENNAVLGKFYTPTASKLSAEAVAQQVSQSDKNLPQFSYVFFSLLPNFPLSTHY